MSVAETLDPIADQNPSSLNPASSSEQGELTSPIFPRLVRRGALLRRCTKAHCYVGLFGFFDLEQGAGFQVHEACDHRVRHLLDADVEGVYRVVVELAAVRD